MRNIENPSQETETAVDINSLTVGEFKSLTPYQKIAIFAALFPEGLEQILQKTGREEAKKDPAENETMVAAANDPPAAEKPQKLALLQEWFASRSTDEKLACVVMDSIMGGVCKEADEIVRENVSKWRDELYNDTSFLENPLDTFAQGLVIGLEISQQ